MRRAARSRLTQPRQHDEHVWCWKQWSDVQRAHARFPEHDATPALARWMANWMPFAAINNVPEGTRWGVRRDDKGYVIVAVTPDGRKAEWKADPSAPPPPI